MFTMLPPCCVLDHVPRRRLRDAPRAVQVDLDHLLPVFLGVLEQRLGDGDAGVVDDDGDRAERCGRLVERRGDARSIRYVERDGLDADAVGASAILHRSQRFDATRRDRDIRACRGKRLARNGCRGHRWHR